MRPSPLYIAVSLALLCSCSPAPTREQAAATAPVEREEDRARVDEVVAEPARAKEADLAKKAEDKQYARAKVLKTIVKRLEAALD